MREATMETGQRWDPDLYARTASYVPALGVEVLDWLAPRPRERILDLGCGDGALSAVLRERGTRVVGIDASVAMVEAARTRGIDARRRDAHALRFRRSFDGVFSNAALHWMVRPDAVIASVARALRPGGRFVGEMGGEGNVAAVEGALVEALAALGRRVASPWYFPTVADYAGRLAAHGFTVERIVLFARPTLLAGPIEDWLATFGGAYLDALSAHERRMAIAHVVAATAPRLRDSRGAWRVDYVRLRFAARLTTP